MNFNSSLHSVIEQSVIAKNKITDYVKDIMNHLRYGYGCSKSSIPNLKMLTLYQNVLQRNKFQRQLGVTPFLSSDTYQALREKITHLTGKNCKAKYNDLEIDQSERDAWIASNPTCVSYQEWEKWVYYFCGEIDIELSTIEEACNFMFEITRETIPCDVLLAISVYKEACKTDLTVQRSDHECKLDFNLLHEKVNCDLDFNTYRSLVNCNLSFDVIRTVYECGLKLETTKTAGSNQCNPVLVSDLGEYSLRDIQGNINLTPLKKLGLKTKLNKKDLLQDYGK